MEIMRNAIFVRVMMNMKVVHTAVKIRLVLIQITTEYIAKAKAEVELEKQTQRVIKALEDCSLWEQSMN